MNVTFYKFKKRVNSTMQPTTTGTTTNIQLKENCSIIHPIFIVSAVYASYNYVYFEGRYYWVNNVVYVTKDIIEMSCDIDVLASYKSEIGAETQYIMRASNPDAYAWGRLITDNLYPTLANYFHQSTIRVGSFDTVNGWYCVGVILGNFSITKVAGGSAYLQNVAVARRGAVTYFRMNRAQLEELTRVLSKLELVQADVNPLQFIVSCVYIPVENEEPFDSYILSTNYAGTRYSDTQENFSFFVCDKPSNCSDAGIGTVLYESVEMPLHLLSARGYYLNYSPYIKYEFEAGPFGVFDIPPEYISMDNRSIDITIDCDYPTGSAVMKIYRGDFLNSAVFMTLDAQLGIDVQLAQITSNSLNGVFNTVVPALNAVASIAYNPLGAVNNIAGALQSAYNNTLPHVQSNGSNASMTALDYPLNINVYNLNPVSENLEDVGRVVCHRLKISDIAGYIICSDADIDNIEATAEEIEMVKTYLNNGFFYE